MATPSSTADTPSLPIAKYYQAFPYDGATFTTTTERLSAQNRFLDRYSNVKIGGRMLSGIVSEVDELTAPGRSRLTLTEAQGRASVSILLTGDTTDTGGNPRPQRLVIQGPALTDAVSGDDRDAIRTIQLLHALSNGTGNTSTSQTLTAESAAALIAGCDRVPQLHPLVRGDITKVKSAIDTAMKIQETSGTFKLSLDETPTLKAQPAFSKIMRNKNSRDRFMGTMKSASRPDHSISSLYVTESFLGRDYGIISEGLQKLERSLIADYVSKDPVPMWDALSEHMTDEGKQFMKYPALDKRYSEMEANITVASAARAEALSKTKIADMMSQDLMVDINSYLPLDRLKYSKSTDRQWPKPTEYLTVEDKDYEAFFGALASMRVEQNVASLTPAQMSQCMSNFPVLRSKIETILQGQGPAVLAKTRAQGDNSATWAEDYAQKSYLDYARDELEVRGKEMEGLYDVDPLEIFPPKVAEEYKWAIGR
ncbi:uncharacterized protein L199_005740 [Kwoniella botswanensis]|uniref:uncharacterized protein n=1 Tax=Kwoniella botswanensis TaxID=1268659 RepID=UPI00315DD603